MHTENLSRWKHGHFFDTGNYDAMCAQCHLGPGLGDSEIHKGLYPAPPNLSIINKNLDSAHSHGHPHADHVHENR